MSTETTNKKIKIDNGTTFGKTYTDKAIDAKLPTDLIASANKLSLGVGNAPLGSGVNLSGFTYDEATKTLKAKGGGATLPAGTASDPFVMDSWKLYGGEYHWPEFHIDLSSNEYCTISISDTLRINGKSNTLNPDIFISNEGRKLGVFTSLTIESNYNSRAEYRIRNVENTGINYIPSLLDPEAAGEYILCGTKDSTKLKYSWKALKKTYNHYIVISDGTASNAIYLLIPSSNNLICSSLPELNTLLGTTNRFIQASGVVTDTASKLPIVALNWQGSFSSSKIVTMSSEEATTKFTSIVDVVEPA